MQYGGKCNHELTRISQSRNSLYHCLKISLLTLLAFYDNESVHIAI